MDETEHLLSNPENERRLREAIEELERRRGNVRRLTTQEKESLEQETLELQAEFRALRVAPSSIDPRSC